MEFLRALGSFVIAQLARSIFRQIKEMAEQDIITPLSHSVQKAIALIALRLFFAVLSVGGFLMFFFELMRQIDVYGGLHANAQLIGPITLSAVFLCLFVLIGLHDKKKAKESMEIGKTTEEPRKSSGLEVFLHELRDEREQFRGRKQLSH